MTWELGAMGYFAAMLTVYPALAGRYKWIGCRLIGGIGGMAKNERMKR